MRQRNMRPSLRRGLRVAVAVSLLSLMSALLGIMIGAGHSPLISHPWLGIILALSAIYSGLVVVIVCETVQVLSRIAYTARRSFS